MHSSSILKVSSRSFYTTLHLCNSYIHSFKRPHIYNSIRKHHSLTCAPLTSFHTFINKRDKGFGIINAKCKIYLNVSSLCNSHSNENKDSKVNLSNSSSQLENAAGDDTLILSKASKLVVPDDGHDEVQVISWAVSQGDMVDIGDIICEIETPDYSYNFESMYSGFVANLMVEPNTVIKPGSLLCYLANTKEDLPKIVDCCKRKKKE